jgi:hypothetical protein
MHAVYTHCTQINNGYLQLVTAARGGEPLAMTVHQYDTASETILSLEMSKGNIKVHW